MSVKQSSISVSGSGNHYFNNYTTTTLYVELSIGFPAAKISLVNDSDTDPVQVSFDGATLHYQMAGAEYKDLIANGVTSVYVKATTGGAKVRVTAE